MKKIKTCPELIDYIERVGFLPLLAMGIRGWSAQEIVDPSCNYVTFPDGGWDWPLWKWKGPILEETNCAYGKFFKGKAVFITSEWWPHFCNYRRSKTKPFEPDSIESAILETLQTQGSMTTRTLRDACSFTGKNMRGKFDTLVGHLEMGAYVVTENFVYSIDKHGQEYGWGSSLLTTPEQRFGRAQCHPNCSPEESFAFMREHLVKTFNMSDSLIEYIL